MRKWFWVYLTLILIFLYFPIIYMVVYSFNANGDMTHFTGFSIAAYQELFANTNLFIVLINTLVVGLISALFSVIIGFAGAMVLYNIKSKQGQMLFNMANALFLVSPDVIIGTSLLSIFTLWQIHLGMGSVILAHIAFSVPPVVIIIYAKLSSMNSKLINAARDLGANNLQVITRVILPIIFPAIMSSFFTALTYSLDDFAVTFFVTGNGFQTLAIDIYTQARQGISLTINALSTIIFVFMMLGSIIYFLISRKKAKQNEKNRSY